MEELYGELCGQLSRLLDEVRARALSVNDEARALESLIARISEMFPEGPGATPEEMPTNSLDDIGR